MLIFKFYNNASQSMNQKNFWVPLFDKDDFWRLFNHSQNDTLIRELKDSWDGINFFNFTRSV